MRDLGQVHLQRLPRKRLSRALAIAFVACASIMTAGCAHIDRMLTDEAAPKPAVRKAAPAKAAVSVSPERRAEAKALHATALDQMGRGAYGPATSNLTQAAKLDPTNEQIQHDLARANRTRGAIGAGGAPSRSNAAD